MPTALPTRAIRICLANGYATGLFGKWHLGTLTTAVEDANRGLPGDATHYSLPTSNGFDTYLATESKVPTFDPLIQPLEFDTARGESLRYGWSPVVNSDAARPYGTLPGRDPRRTAVLRHDHRNG